MEDAYYMGEIWKDDYNKVTIGDGENRRISSQTVEANILFAILEKLDEIRCGIIDVESAVNPR